MAEHVAQPEEAADEALPETSPAAFALALGEARAGGRLAPEAAAFLAKQSKLIDLQTEHLHEQRELQLGHLRVRRWKDRTSVALQGLGAVIGAAVAIAFGVMLWQAHEDHGLIVEAFSVPPDLAQRGLTGQVAAAKVLDQLADLQAKTNSARAPSSYANNWGDDIKVEIPETGVSIGELNRYLRRWLGHQTVITGEVVRTAAGLAVTARTGADAGATFEGPEADLDKLFQQAAEAVYRRTQPYRYGSLLTISGEAQKSRPILETLQADSDANERRWAALGLANIDLYSGDVPAAERAYEAMDRRDPSFVMGVDNIGQAALTLDHEQKTLDAARRALALLPGDSNPQITRSAAKVMARSAVATISEFLGDFQDGARHEAELTELPDYDGSRVTALLASAADLAFDHQPAASAAVLAGAHAPAGVLPIYDAAFEAQLATTRVLSDIGAEHWTAAIADGAHAQALATTSTDAFIRYAIARQVLPWMAYAKARTGDQASAEALIAGTPLDCDTCVRLRGKIAVVKGDWAGAERWFVMATRQAPSIPFAYADWGAMLLAKGDVNAAVAKLQMAHEKGPHYADALELWGEALMRKGDNAGAAAKFAEAGKYAPHWDLNNRMWRQALAKAQGHG